MLTPAVPAGRVRSGRFGGFVALCLVTLATSVTAEAPGVVVPTGRQEYFVLGYEQHLYNMLRRVYDEYGAALASARMNSVVSVVVSADGQSDARPRSPFQCSWRFGRNTFFRASKPVSISRLPSLPPRR
jgi:hypothetical protein